MQYLLINILLTKLYTGVIFSTLIFCFSLKKYFFFHNKYLKKAKIRKKGALP